MVRDQYCHEVEVRIDGAPVTDITVVTTAMQKITGDYEGPVRIHGRPGRYVVYVGEWISNKAMNDGHMTIPVTVGDYMVNVVVIR